GYRHSGRHVAHAPTCYCYFFCIRLRAPISTLFPYTTLFRSRGGSREPLGRADIEEKFFRNARLGGWRDEKMDAALTLAGTLWDGDRKSTRLNSSHGSISYAVFCLKKKHCQSNTRCGPRWG